MLCVSTEHGVFVSTDFAALLTDATVIVMASFALHVLARISAAVAVPVWII